MTRTHIGTHIARHIAPPPGGHRRRAPKCVLNSTLVSQVGIRYRVDARAASARRLSNRPGPISHPAPGAHGQPRGWRIDDSTQQVRGMSRRWPPIPDPVQHPECQTHHPPHEGIPHAELSGMPAPQSPRPVLEQARRTATKERDIQAAVLALLRVRGIHAWRANVGAVSATYAGRQRFIRFGVKGMSDVLGIIPPNGRLRRQSKLSVPARSRRRISKPSSTW